MSRRRRAAVRLAAALLILYWIALFAATHMPLPAGIDLTANRDKLLHVAAYAALAFLGGVAAMPFFQSSYLRLMLVAGVMLLYGVIDEGGQMFVPGRVGDIWDWLADALGVFLGIGSLAALENAYAAYKARRNASVERE